MRCTATTRTQQHRTGGYAGGPRYDRTPGWRGGDPSDRCRREAVRQFTNGEALCQQHLDDRLLQHDRVVVRIQALTRG